LERYSHPHPKREDSDDRNRNTLMGALDPDRPREEVVAFASELYDNVTTRVAREPAKLRCNWKLSQLLVTKDARAL